MGDQAGGWGIGIVDLPKLDGFMNGLQTAHAPSPAVVVPHFVAGGIAFFAAVLLMVFSAPSFLESYHHDHVLAIVHILLLGWGSMMIFGALYQLIPVVYETSLYSEPLAVVTFWMFAVSVPFLSYSFWTGSYAGMLFYSSILMFLSLLLFVVNLLMTYRNSRKRNIQSRFITTAVFWLAMTELLGLLIALNFRYGFLSQVHLHYLKIHAHLGLVGWFLLLIMGAASILIPMFMVSHSKDESKLHYAYFAVNGGLLVISSDWLWFHSRYGMWLGIAGILSGIVLFWLQMYQAYKHRLRKELDKGLQYTRNSMVALLLGSLLSVRVAVWSGQGDISKWVVVYGFVTLFGFISMLILGQTYKTLPFIIWLERYKKYVGKYKTPMPRELYHEGVVRFQYVVFLSGLLVFPAGVLTGNRFLMVVGAVLLVLTSVLHLYNIVVMIRHKVKLKEL